MTIAERGAAIQHAIVEIAHLHIAVYQQARLGPREIAAPEGAWIDRLVVRGADWALAMDYNRWGSG